MASQDAAADDRPASSRTARSVSGRIAIVVSSYHGDLTEKLADGARATLQAGGIPAQRIEEFTVPGAWELPLASRWICDTGKFVAIIALGVVIRGETSHDQHINRFVSLSLGQLSLDAGIPIAFGLLTCDTLGQARDRSGGKVGNKGNEAAEAALAMLRLRQTIRG